MAAIHPDKIILFGSYAYGNPNPHSDLDLLVVTNTTKSIFDRHKQISRLFPHRLFSLDILVKTPAEVSHRIEIEDSFFLKILARGRVLYERGNGRRVGAQSRRRLRKRAPVGASAQKTAA
ncbi:MAG: nucleotidyltransferase domain-containing protein [Chloroflexota bacterium]|nr:nucleotidyltransferase domain-containing protein [Chloroflexota bacterium]